MRGTGSLPYLPPIVDTYGSLAQGVWRKDNDCKVCILHISYANRCLVAIRDITTPRAHNDLSCSAALKNNY
jgi:hypothetical protein